MPIQSQRPILPAGGRPGRGLLRSALMGVIVIIAVGAAGLAVWPAAVSLPDAPGRPAASWDEAVGRVRTIQAAEAADPSLLPACRTRLYDHGARTVDVVVLFHGYTNCPTQFDALAQQFADLGYTVLVPRMAAHGAVPGTAGLFGSLSGEQVVAHADASMDIAVGLGDHVAVLGLSGGGAVASYVAQFRPDVDRVVAVAAFLGIPQVPGWLTPAAINAILLAPPVDQYDPAPDEARRGAYPHGASDTSTHAAVAYMRVGQTVFSSAVGEGPKAGSVVLVINDADTTVNNAMIEDLGRWWNGIAPDRSSIYHFDASLGILHDMITPDRDGQRVDLVYPLLIELVANR